MKIEIETSRFDYALSMISASISNRVTLPVLKNVLIESEEFEDGTQALRLVSTDLESTTIVRVPATVHDPGKIAIPAYDLREIVSNAPGETFTITLSKQRNHMRYKSGSYKGRLLVVDPSSYPNITDTEWVDVSVKLGDIKSLLKRVSTASQPNNSENLNMSSVRVGWEVSRLIASAADGFRMTRGSIPMVRHHDDDIPPVVIPISVISSLGSLLRTIKHVDDDFDIMLTIPDGHTLKQVGFDFGSVVFLGSLADVEYKDFPVDQVIQGSTESMKVAASDFRLAMKSVAVLAKKYVNAVNISIPQVEGVEYDSDLIYAKCVGYSPEHGRANKDMPVRYTGVGMEMSVNIQYLSDGVSAAGTDTVDIRMRNSQSPIVIFPHYEDDMVDDDFVYIVMPIDLIKIPEVDS